MSFSLRPYQQDFSDRIAGEFVAGRKSVLGVLPTGGGKTVVFSHIARGARAKSNRTTILVHRDFLVEQTSSKLSELNIPHGIIAPGHHMNSELIQVASVDTLVRRLHIVPEPKLIVSDEAHHIVAGKWIRIMSAYRNSLTLGVTATPERLDGTGLGLMFESMIVGVSMEELIAEGWLVQPIVYAPPLPVDYSRVRRMKNGEYEDKELEKLLDQRAVTGCAIQHYKNICDGVPAVAFCTSVDHAIHVAMEFNRAGISAREIHGKQSKIERKRILADFKAGAIKVLTSCELISEGFDLPSVGAAILLRPTDSLSLYLQQVGRALRADDGKEFAFILDHVGNCFQHGLPDDARLWSLEGKEKRLAMSKTPAVRQCPKCYAAFAPAQNCPVCGFALEVQTRRTQDIEVREGELKPVDEIAKKRAIKAEELKRRASQCKSLDDLRALGESLGYKPKWAEMRWRARQARLQSRGIGR